jgi:hypothetical protein
MKNAIIKSKGAKRYLVSAEPPAEGMEAAARINHWHTIVKQAGEMAIAAALNAGLELFKAKIDHPGTFEKWIEANCDFSRRTAYKYLALVQQALSADELPKIANGSDKMRQTAIEDYASRTNAKSLMDLYCDFGIVKRPDWGGEREGAGRKRKTDADVAAQLEQIAQSETLNWSAVKTALESLFKLQEEKDVWTRLTDEHLAAAVKTLTDLQSAAADALKARMAGKVLVK